MICIRCAAFLALPGLKNDPELMRNFDMPDALNLALPFSAEQAGSYFKKAVADWMIYTSVITGALVLSGYLKPWLPLVDDRLELKDYALLGFIGSSATYWLKQFLDADRLCPANPTPAEPVSKCHEFFNTRVVPFLFHFSMLAGMTTLSSIVLYQSRDIALETLAAFGLASAMLGPVVITAGTLSYFSCFKHCLESLRQCKKPRSEFDRAVYALSINQARDQARNQHTTTGASRPLLGSSGLPALEEGLALS